MGRAKAQRSNRGIKVAQLNIDRMRVVTAELRERACESGVSVLAVQEPYVGNDGRVSGFGVGARVVVGASGDERVWAAVVVLDPGVGVLRLGQLCDSHCVVVQLVTGVGAFYVVSMYFQPSHEINGYIERLERIARVLRGANVVVCMDGNARNEAWGGRVTQDRGVELEMGLNEIGWIVLNDGKLPTFKNFRGESYIDLTVVSPGLRSGVSGWRVEVDWTSSAHRVLRFVVGGERNNEGMRRERALFKLRKADWDLFRESLRESAPGIAGSSVSSKKDVVKLVQTVEDWILKSARRAIPIGVRRARAVCWWSGELERMKLELVSIRREYQREADEVERESVRRRYGRSRSRYKAAVRRAKRESWGRFVVEEEEKGPWNLVYKLAVGKVKPESVMGMIGESEGVIDWRESAGRLLNGLVVDDAVDDEGEEHLRVRSENRRYNPEFGARWGVTEEEVRRAVWRSKNGKAPGWDGICVEMLKEGWREMSAVLRRMYGLCVKFRVFPDRWKWGRIRALLKKEDKDPKLVKSYRPICLLPVLGKVFERMIVDRLEWVFYGGVHEMQYGFMRGRGTEDAMYELRRATEESVAKYTMGVFLDVSGAFDRVWWPSVLKGLREKGVGKECYEIMIDYLSRRRVELHVGAGVVRKEVNMGCPQGSVLGPQVWKLVFDSCVRSLNEEGFKMIAFADDGVIIVQANSRRDLEERANEAIRRVGVWMGLNKMGLSVEKTVCMMLKGRLARSPRVFVGENVLECVKNVKYLGVVWDEGLKISKHVGEVCDRAVGLFNRVMDLHGRVGGLRGRFMRILYKGLFLAIVCYGAGAWGDKLGSHARRRLRVGHRRVLLRMARAYRTISNDALEVLVGVWPLDLEIERRWCGYKLRKYGKVEWRGRELEGVRVRGGRERVCMDEWQKAWDESEKGRWTYEWLPSVSERVCMDWVNVNYYVCQVLSGHGCFRAKLFGFGLVENAWCECGENEEDSVQHVVYECGLYEVERLRLWRGLEAEGLERTKSACMTEVGFELLREFARVVIEKKEETERRMCGVV